MKNILISILIMMGVSTTMFSFFHFPKNREPQILDGPGSYLDCLSGEITEISDKEDGYIVTIKLDAESYDLFRKEYAKAVIENDAYENSDMFSVGAHIEITFPGGMSHDEEPLLIESVYQVYPVNDKNEYL